MHDLSPKQLEIRNRESRILELAREMVRDEGYHGLSMDRIAQQLDYSKGTIYNHFACKEEIIVALAIQTVEVRVQMFRKAAQFKGCSRFRMMAIGEAAEQFVLKYPDHFVFEQILQLPTVRQKVSEKRQNAVENCDVQCMTVVAGVARDAVAAEDLVLPTGFTPEMLVFGLWALTSGGYAIAAASESLAHIGLENPYRLVNEHTSALLDGFGWKPLSPEYDRAEILQRIRTEVFGDE